MFDLFSSSTPPPPPAPPPPHTPTPPTPPQNRFAFQIHRACCPRAHLEAPYKCWLSLSSSYAIKQCDYNFAWRYPKWVFRHVHICCVWLVEEGSVHSWHAVGGLRTQKIKLNSVENPETTNIPRSDTAVHASPAARNFTQYISTEQSYSE